MLDVMLVYFIHWINILIELNKVLSLDVNLARSAGNASEI